MLSSLKLKNIINYVSKIFFNPPHLQTREFEGIYVLNGELTFNVEGKQVISKAGTMINIPLNVIHSFKNNTDNVVRVLVIIAPAGMEKLFEEVGTEVFDTNIAKSSNPSNEEKKRSLEISKRYGVEMIE
ncbi:MAG: cupin domain-containing protein [Nitrososphaeraceae archaeon]